jgi:hypothetical protein
MARGLLSTPDLYRRDGVPPFGTMGIPVRGSLNHPNRWISNRLRRFLDLPRRYRIALSIP